MRWHFGAQGRFVRVAGVDPLVMQFPAAFSLEPVCCFAVAFSSTLARQAMQLQVFAVQLSLLWHRHDPFAKGTAASG